MFLDIDIEKTGAMRDYFDVIEDEPTRLRFRVDHNNPLKSLSLLWTIYNLTGFDGLEALYFDTVKVEPELLAYLIVQHCAGTNLLGEHHPLRMDNVYTEVNHAH